MRQHKAYDPRCADANLSAPVFYEEKMQLYELYEVYEHKLAGEMM
jgi:hypothetical protein